MGLCAGRGFTCRDFSLGHPLERKADTRAHTDPHRDDPRVRHVPRRMRRRQPHRRCALAIRPVGSRRRQTAGDAPHRRAEERQREGAATAVRLPGDDANGDRHPDRLSGKLQQRFRLPDDGRADADLRRMLQLAREHDVSTRAHAVAGQLHRDADDRGRERYGARAKPTTSRSHSPASRHR